MAACGGPIARIELGELSIVGVRQFQANAYLRPDLCPWAKPRQIFSNATGSGTDRSPMVARFKSISEAIERWAHGAATSSRDAGRYGFDRDSSSTGMAAYPGLLAKEARSAAQAEASERFNLLSWWEGNLQAVEADSPFPNIQAAVLHSEAPGMTVLLHCRTPDGLIAYGHAAGSTFADACQRAAGELERYALVFRHHRLATVGTRSAFEAVDLLEQRSLFFSTEHGYELFLERLRSRPRHSRIRPSLIFDGPIPGPWNRYAHVWRVAYEPPSDRFTTSDPTYFFW